MAKPFLFIINPKSGGFSGRRLPELERFISSQLAFHRRRSEIVVTEAGGHASEIVEEALKREEWAAMVAVGGDGTINEVARSLLHTDTPLGILPAGSGNGLARHLEIPVSANRALEILVREKSIRIDSARINGTPFFCTSGIGFDAAVSHRFAASRERGLKNYVRYSLEVFKEFEPVCLIQDRQKVPAFLLTFANAGQFGNNAWIAPKAFLADGLLDLSFTRPFPLWYTPVFTARMFMKTLHQSHYTSFHKFKELKLEVEAPVFAHYDGEPFLIKDSAIHVRCVPNSLSVIC